MLAEKKDIITRLQRDVLILQGIKSAKGQKTSTIDLGPVDLAFPDKCFPEGAIHEFINNGEGYAASTGGFIACLTGELMNKGGVAVWISASRTVFPPAMKQFGTAPDKIVFIDLKKEKDALWVMEEALKCSGIAAVICETKELSFTASRRLQLAVEQSRVTGFIIRNQPHRLIPNACLARWKITSLPSEPENKLPGIGFPRWNVELLKIRNGKPGSWQLEWSAGKLHAVEKPMLEIQQEPQRKTG